MNKNAKNKLDTVIDELQKICDEIDDIKCEENEKIDNMSDFVRQGERGQRIEEGVELMEKFQSEVKTCINTLYDLLVL